MLRAGRSQLATARVANHTTAVIATKRRSLRIQLVYRCFHRPRTELLAVDMESMAGDCPIVEGIFHEEVRPW
jgi:hypothetical protein